MRKSCLGLSSQKLCLAEFAGPRRLVQSGAAAQRVGDRFEIEALGSAALCDPAPQSAMVGSTDSLHFDLFR